MFSEELGVDRGRKVRRGLSTRDNDGIVTTGIASEEGEKEDNPNQQLHGSYPLRVIALTTRAKYLAPSLIIPCDKVSR